MTTKHGSQLRTREQQILANPPTGEMVLAQSSIDDLDLSTIPATVLIVGGTGMLRLAVTTLVMSGRTVVLVARHASRFAASITSTSGCLLPVDANWQDAAVLAARVGAVETAKPIGAALLWVHHPHLDQVTHELHCVLPQGVELVRLRGTGGADVHVDAGTHSEGRRIHEVLLGSVEEFGRRRWLSHEEISVGSLKALATLPGTLVVGNLAP